MEPDTFLASTGAADVLLRGRNLLAPVERELIAVHVSAVSNCAYCLTVHSAIAAHYLGGDDQIVTQVKEDYRKAPITEKLRALLAIAEKVEGDGKKLTDSDILRARRKGATDLEIHDTLLIASMFCMCNGKGWRPDKALAKRTRANVKRKLKRKAKRGEN
jgi:uncharacterized peroxidase-related enzyme